MLSDEPMMPPGDVQFSRQPNDGSAEDEVEAAGGIAYGFFAH